MTDNSSPFTPHPSHFLREINPRNLLSFGPEAQPIALERLNVLIGPNGSGKSNFIEAIVLLSVTPVALRAVIRRGGGVREWIWKGAPKAIIQSHKSHKWRFTLTATQRWLARRGLCLEAATVARNGGGRHVDRSGLRGGGSGRGARRLARSA